MESQNLAEKVLDWLKKCGSGFVSTAAAAYNRKE